MTLQGKTVLVLGLGESGLAMAQWLTRLGARVRVADSRSEPPHAAELKRSAPGAELLTGSFNEELLAGIEMLGLSPGLSLDEPVVAAAARRGIPVVGEIELFAGALREHGLREACRVIAITGTNGKTTTTAMAGALCRAAGKMTAVAGNIGPAALSALMACLDAGKLPEIWVLELSSFQLETTVSLEPDAAAVLNVTDDHLDRYAGMDDYAAAKARIFAGSGVQVLNRQDVRVMEMARAGRRRLTFGLDAPADAADFGLAEGWLMQGGERLMRSDELALSGLHNVANALAALALCRAIGLPLAPQLPALREFKGLPHRVERIAEFDGVAWYDDSKGTNVGATVAALEGLGGQMAAQTSHLPPAGREVGREGASMANTRYQNNRKIVLIAGGDGKGQDFSPLGPALASHARALVLIGRDAMNIEAAVTDCGIPITHAQDMDQAVRKAAVAARAGDAVLLSPACASFDMFRDYAHRAEVFAQAVFEVAQARQKEAS
ncbi:MAG: UDP-N-acetylmuramoyl-L-alanine--D-glutamate ligase [Rhodocyclaceae bacterium]|nr:UDP-N-acetylmuramoyl-L-alanine--D-glutamate ligase [Burkholderiales bacterium]MBX3677082.1 UDP-N-acetylmuramoyl-L-alanine--D-glutamate ligase [Rhodocyclaceae bacterium]